jgi:hypothetical protein
MDEKNATIYALGCYQEMGSNTRNVPAKVRVDDAGLKVGGALAPGEGAAPIITEDGSLMGFLAARTDPAAELGGEDRIIDLTAINNLMKLAKTGSAAAPIGRVKHTVTTQPAPGRALLVIGVHAEKFEEK